MYLPHPKIPEVLELLKTGDDRFPVLLIGEEDPLDIEALCRAAKEAGLAFMGGIFPRVIHGEEVHTTGLVRLQVPAAAPPFVVHQLDQLGTTPSLPDEKLSGDEVQAMLIFIDGLTSNIGEFLGAVFGQFGSRLAYFGGGAGSLTLKQQPAVITEDGLFQDAAILLPIRHETKLGVQHGWQRLQGPFVASRTDKNSIIELNWRNAFEVYKETVEPVIGESLTPDNFFAHAKAFPFGMSRDGCEDIVRDPITVTEEGHLVCVGEVAQHSVLHILNGQAEQLIAAAADAGGACPSSSPDNYLLVDCISRVLFLGDRFREELAAVQQGNGLSTDTKLVGALTLGEISSIGGGYLELLNKTMVFAEFSPR